MLSAITNDDIEWIKNHPGDINKKLEDGRYPVEHVIETKDINIVRVFVENGLDIDTTTPSSYGLLHLAYYHGKIDILKYLIDVGCDINKLDSYNRTVAHYAARESDGVYEYIISIPSYLSFVDVQNMTPEEIRDEYLNTKEREDSEMRNGTKLFIICFLSFILYMMVFIIIYKIIA